MILSPVQVKQTKQDKTINKREYQNLIGLSNRQN